MPLLYESYTLVKTWDPLRRTPVVHQVDEHSGVVEVGKGGEIVGLAKVGKKGLQAVPYSHWWSFLAGIGAGFLVFPFWLKKAGRI